MSFVRRNMSRIAAIRSNPVASSSRAGSCSSTSGRQQHHQRFEDHHTMFGTTIGDIETVGFERIGTTHASWIQLIFSMILTMTGFIFAYHGCYSGNECPGYYMVLYLRALFWLATYVIHLYMKSKHNRLKLLGYHKFLRITHRQKKAPLQLVSLSNLLILTIHTIILELYGTNFINDCYVKGLSLTLFLSIWCLVECMILTYIHVTYFVKVRVFNTMRSPPDALTSAEIRRNAHHRVSAEELINQQFLMIVKMMDDNRHLQDKIREVRAAAHLINSESTHLSMAEQSLLGF
ncbi:AAEL013295-PA [Aedes aegypti]|uniref:Transmembrane protein 192 n=1 Tax=Aedes aegypti TaxID=7159 RepID=Q16JL1_AEDAE|nr:AAEL013295-PA [Aedes aegypti]